MYGIRYDGHDLSILDLNALRRQFGVVLQTISLLPSTIKDNIIGINSELTEEDAWAIVKKPKILMLDESMRDWMIIIKKVLNYV